VGLTSHGYERFYTLEANMDERRKEMDKERGEND